MCSSGGIQHKWLSKKDISANSFLSKHVEQRSDKINLHINGYKNMVLLNTVKQTYAMKNSTIVTALVYIYIYICQ